MDANHMLLIAIVGAVQGIIIAVIGVFHTRESKRRKRLDERVDKRAKMRAEESRLSMHLASANVSLGIATALAVKEGRANGKMDSALDHAEMAQREYYAFLNKLAAQQISDDV